MNEVKFSIESINMIGQIVFKINSTNECLICKCNLNSNSIYDLNDNEELKICEGECGHQFHYKCINHIIKNNKLCCACSKPWVCKKISTLDIVNT